MKGKEDKPEQEGTLNKNKMDTITGNKLPDDIRAKILDKAKKYSAEEPDRFYEELLLAGVTVKLLKIWAYDDFINGLHEGYLLSVDKDKEIAEGRKEIERLEKELDAAFFDIDLFQIENQRLKSKSERTDELINRAEQLLQKAFLKAKEPLAKNIHEFLQCVRERVTQKHL